MAKALRMAAAKSVDEEDALLLLLLLLRGANAARDSGAPPSAALAALYLPSMSRMSCSSLPRYRRRNTPTFAKFAGLCAR